MRSIKFLYMLPLLAALVSCSNDDDALPVLPNQEGVNKTFSEVLDLEKDKAKYVPGEEVNFSVDAAHPDVVVRYKLEGEVIAEESLAGTSWSWTAPSEDFKGYMVELVKITGGDETVLGTVGVDVSSDWTRFPRYGFLSEFGNVASAERTRVLERLKNFHINGLQYYDWHSKHHIPLPIDENGVVAESWTDLFNREIYLESVEGYIGGAKDFNMSSMFYNLLFGAWNPEEGDGFSNQWLMFKDRNHNEVDMHRLEGLGDILLTDPSNDEWQEYIFEETSKVYENLPFDGWHLDQLGDRGILYDYNGYQVDLGEGYQEFLTKLDNRFPEKKIALNAVDQYEQKDILETPVDFAYSEVWSRNQYQDLVNVILENNSYSNGEVNTVLAAYMNYESQSGTFNTPSVLLADAVIFAFGGAHLELGEHMLSSEYFPSTKLTMDQELETSLKEYYDFLVAYQNLLRDGGAFNNVGVGSTESGVKLNNWPPVFGQTAVVGKDLEDKQVVHLLNFDGVNTMKWRDDEKIQTTPLVKNNFEVTINSEKNVSRVWFASPDVDGGASQEVEFKQDGNNISLDVPYLKYWSMLVLEY